MEAASAEFNNHPLIEAFVIKGEWSFGRSTQHIPDADNFSRQAFGRAYFDILAATRRAAPNTMFLVGMNFLQAKENKAWLYEALDAGGVGFTAPDIFPAKRFGTNRLPEWPMPANQDIGRHTQDCPMPVLRKRVASFSWDVWVRSPKTAWKPREQC